MSAVQTQFNCSLVFLEAILSSFQARIDLFSKQQIREDLFYTSTTFIPLHARFALFSMQPLSTSYWRWPWFLWVISSFRCGYFS